jgi:two-component system sensor histidine kinase TctE
LSAPPDAKGLPAPSAEKRPQGESSELNSLFGEILDWMLAPLLFLWPISIAATHHVANEIANQPYDQALSENVTAIVRLVRIDGQRVSINLPSPARALLRSDEEDNVYFQVVGSRGEILAGDEAIPIPERPAQINPGEVLLRDDTNQGEPLRVATTYLPVRAGQPVRIQVAETRRKREGLASRIITGVLLPQFAIIPLAVILVYMGLTRGLAPLSRLQARIRDRRPGDLSPVPLRRVPDELRPMVASFNEMMQRLEENLQAQHRFIADAAHQLKTPLTGLRMQAELAQGETDPVQLHEYVKRIAGAAERASHLTQQLLVLARAEASHEKVHAVEIMGLGSLVRQITEEWVPHALDRQIDLGFEGSDWPLVIDGNPMLLRELLNNLIDNAIKYTPSGGRVTVRVRPDVDAVIEVEDSGLGIPESERTRVFERFYRVLGSGAEGSGLGLPIVREIAELHRGRVELLAAASGQGTLARVHLPCREDWPRYDEIYG